MREKGMKTHTTKKEQELREEDEESHQEMLSHPFTSHGEPHLVGRSQSLPTALTATPTTTLSTPSLSSILLRTPY